jgi:hypothetical protein
MKRLGAMMMGLVVCCGVAACGSSSTGPSDGAGSDRPLADGPGADRPADAQTIDAAPGTDIEISKWPRGSETFTALPNGGALPLIQGFQGFTYVEIQLRVPASVPAGMTPLALHYDVAGGSMDQNNSITLAAGATRDSDRYLIYLNQFSISMLDGASCHLQASLPSYPGVATLDTNVTLHASGCIDTGAAINCPDGGVP